MNPRRIFYFDEIKEVKQGGTYSVCTECEKYILGFCWKK